jgi:hypothetical protein
VRTFQVIAAILVATAIILLLVGAIRSVKSAHDQRIESQLEIERGRLETQLLECRLRWPLKGERYELCVTDPEGETHSGHRLMYRTDF